MHQTIKWLNENDDGSVSGKLFLLDSDTYTLYRINKDPKKAALMEFTTNQLSSCSVNLPGTKQEQEIVRSCALDHTTDNRLAIGFTSGRISIVSADVDHNVKFLRGEDIREAQKSITFLDWNFNDAARLSAAYERGRGADHAVVVYDLNRTTRTVREFPMTIFEANFTEKVFGVSWFSEDTNLLLISGTRGIRLADIREHGSFHSSLSTQNPMLGVCTEPNNGYRFACYAHNLVFVYDRRYLSSSPLHEVEACSDTKILNKLSWHPRRLFHLSALAKDSGNFIHLPISSGAFRQTQKMNSLREEFNGDELSYVTKFYSVCGVTKLAAFDWHPSIMDRLALLSRKEGRTSLQSSQKPLIITLREDVSCDMGSNGDFATINGKKLKIDKIEKFLGESVATLDVVENMFKARIQAGYGYGNTLNPFSTLIENSRRAIEKDQLASEDLHFCWNWLWLMFQSNDSKDNQNNYGTMFAGIKHMLKGAKSNSTIKQDDVTYRNRIFVNEKRLRILRICNWPNYADREECKAKFDEIAEQRGVHGITRAAALALFSVQGILCKEYLMQLSDYTHGGGFAESGHSREFIDNYQRMADIVLNVLQKYDGVRIPDYENLCQELVQDDYLLAIIKFLARRDKIYNRIYNEIFESNISLKDKLAFAAIHMDDDSLSAAVDKLIDGLLVQKPLSALFIVGLDDQTTSHQILHRYLDLTGDIQTVSLLLTIGSCFRKCKTLQDISLIGIKVVELLERAIISEPIGSAKRRSLHCFRDYVDLLNRWKFWLPKTFLCLFLRPKNSSSEIDARSKFLTIQAVIACNFCGSPIYPSIAERIENIRIHTQRTGSFPRRMGTSSRTRSMSCLCRKPLPKCIICRKYLGTMMEHEAEPSNECESVIDHWVVWCSSCNHGGHLAHVREWFNEYPFCAASGCECNCVRKDHQLRDVFMDSGRGIGKRDG